MPELPEVEVMAERLQRWVGERITDVWVDQGMSLKAGAKYLPGDEYNAVIGQAITGVSRRGKYLVIDTSSGALLCHNAMSGYWDADDDPWTFDYVEGKRVASLRDVRVSLRMGDNGCFTIAPWIQFHDARKFGSLRFMEKRAVEEKLKYLGPEAMKTPRCLEPKGIDFDQFWDVLRSPKPVKEVLMDQSRIAGIGNIYASEACFLAGINPLTPAQQIPRDHGIDAEDQSKTALSLLLAIRTALYCALRRNLSYDGLVVYRRKECKVCKGPISSQEVKGRSTWWCPACQN